MIENQSGLEPVGRAVLVRMVELEELKAKLIQIPAHVRQQSSIMEQRAQVVAVGACAWDDEPAPRAKAGDKVIITRMAGYAAVGPKDGQLYRLINDRDIFCKVTGEKND